MEPEASDSRRILRDRLYYSAGVIPYALKEAAFGAFVLFYYKQVLGLSGTLTGLAIALSVVWDAISDPLVGAWSDRLHSRWGRRHPFMLASILPMAIAFIALFQPPAALAADETTLFLWLLGTVILLRTALTFFAVPYLALGAEISRDYHERTRLASARTNLGWFIGVLVPASAFLLLFPDSGGTDGRFIGENYHIYGWMSATGVVVFSIICLRGTWHHIPSLPGADTRSGTPLWQEVINTFRNRNFRFLVLLDTAVGGMAGIIGALLMVTYTYFWQLNTTQISLLFGGPPVVAVILVVATSGSLNRWLEKQQVLRFACAMGAVNLLWLTPLQLFGVLPADADWPFLLIFLNYVIHVTSAILRTVAGHALVADVADEHELNTGRRQEGVMFAATFFAYKFISGFGYLVAGPFLDLIGLEAGAVPGETPASVSWGLGLLMGPGLALLMLLPVWMAFRLDMTRRGQEMVREQLARDDLS